MRANARSTASAIPFTLSGSGKTGGIQNAQDSTNGSRHQPGHSGMRVDSLTSMMISLARVLTTLRRAGVIPARRTFNPRRRYQPIRYGLPARLGIVGVPDVDGLTPLPGRG